MSEKISEMTSLPTPLESGDIFPVVRSGANFKADFDDLPSGGATDTQTTYSTTLLFTGNLVSTFGDTTNNRHTQTGAITFTYNFTGAIEGATRLVEILSNGDTITLPTDTGNTKFIDNQSTTTLTIIDNVITPVDGKYYLLLFWYTNGKVICIIKDAEPLVVDVTPPTFTTAPASSNVQATTFDVTAQTNENATVYGVVLANGATAPNSSEVKAGTGSGGGAVIDSDSASDTGSGVTLNFGGMVGSTDYDEYTVAEDISGNIQVTPVKLDIQTGAASSLPDVSGYNVTRIYSLFETQQSTNSNPIIITDSSANDREVFFDTNGVISLTSKISTNSTPTTDDLQHYVDNIMVGTVVYIKTLRCHITGHTVSTTGQDLKLYESGALLSDMTFAGTNPLTGIALTECDNGDSYTVSVGSTNTSNLSNAALFCNRTTNASDYLVVNNDRRTTQKRISTLKDSGATLFFADALANDNTDSLKRLTVTISTTDMISYLNGTVQTTTDISSQTGYTNEITSIGAFGNGTNALAGTLQYILVHDAELTATNITNLDTILSAL